MLYTLIVYNWQMVLPYNAVEYVIPHNSMLQHICIGRCYFQVADGIAIILSLADVIASGRWRKPCCKLVKACLLIKNWVLFLRKLIITSYKQNKKHPSTLFLIFSNVFY